MKTRTALVALTLLSAIAVDAAAAPKKRVASNKAKKTATTVTAASASTGTMKPLLDCAKTENQKADLCARPVWIKDKAIGSGPHVTALNALGATFSGGTVEGNTLYVGVVNGDAGAVLSVDLTTGNRTLVSGRMEDPANGALKQGTGPDMANPGDVQRGGDGNLYVIARKNVASNTMIFRIDPKTGNRTQVWESNGGNKAFNSCASLGMDSPYPVPMSFAVSGDAMYVAFEDQIRSPGQGIMKISTDGKKCEPLTAWATTGNKGFARGAGPEDPHVQLRGLRIVDGALYALGAGSLYKVDLASGDRKRLSSARPSVGSGADVGQTWLAFDAAKKNVWTSGTFAGGDPTAVSVDLATGNRTEGGFHNGAAARAKQNHGGMWMGPSGKLVMAVDAYALAVVDPVSGNSNLLSQ